MKRQIPNTNEIEREQTPTKLGKNDNHKNQLLRMALCIVRARCARCPILVTMIEKKHSLCAWVQKLHTINFIGKNKTNSKLTTHNYNCFVFMKEKKITS